MPLHLVVFSGLGSVHVHGSASWDRSVLITYGMSRAQHEEHYDENDSQGTADTTDLLIDRLLEDYKIEFQPEVRLKFKRQ